MPSETDDIVRFERVRQAKMDDIVHFETMEKEKEKT